MEPIILEFKKSDYESFCLKVAAAKEATQKFFDKLNEICRIEITRPLMEDLLFSHGKAVAGAIEAAISAELDKAHISSQSIKEAAIKADLKKFYSLLRSFRAPEGSVANNLVVRDGKVAVKDGFFEGAKDRFTRKIETERGKELYEAQKEAAQALQKFFALANRRIFPVEKFAQLFTVNRIENTIEAEGGMFGIRYDRVASPDEKPVSLA